MKSILVIGLGRFGSHIAIRLSEMGNSVLAIDSKEERASYVLPYVTGVQIGDTTNEQFIASLGVNNFDICIVTIGEDFQSSLETTSLLKDYGASFVLARATRDVHKKFLLRNGADQVVYAEKDMAERMAIKYGSKNIFDYIELADGYSIYEISVPRPWIGKTIFDLQIRQKHEINILAIKTNGKIDPVPQANHAFESGETLIVMGADSNVMKLVK